MVAYAEAGSARCSPAMGGCSARGPVLVVGFHLGRPNGLLVQHQDAAQDGRHLHVGNAVPGDAVTGGAGPRLRGEAPRGHHRADSDCAPSGTWGRRQRTAEALPLDVLGVQGAI